MKMFRDLDSLPSAMYSALQDHWTFNEEDGCPYSQENPVWVYVYLHNLHLPMRNIEKQTIQNLYYHIVEHKEIFKKCIKTQFSLCSLYHY